MADMPDINPENCRRRAYEAERQAKECRDPDAGRIYEQIAGHWREIARLAERLRYWPFKLS